MAMPRKALLAIALALPLSAPLAWGTPAQARQGDEEAFERKRRNGGTPGRTQRGDGRTTLSPRATRIPRGSAITVQSCSNVKFNYEQGSSFPITLALARPITDRQGNVVAPVNSLVRARVEPKEDETQLKPKALVVGGRYIPLKTEAVSVPALTDDRNRFRTRTVRTGRGQRGVGFRVANSIDNWLLNRAGPSVFPGEANNTDDFLGLGLAVATGVFQGLNEPNPPDPEEQKVMKVREGIQLIFPLRQAARVPATAARNNPYFDERQPAPACQTNRSAERDRRQFNGGTNQFNNRSNGSSRNGSSSSGRFNEPEPD